MVFRQPNSLQNYFCWEYEIWALFTLYRIALERRDFHTGFGCCLHYAKVIQCATQRKNHSALEVI